MSMLTIPAPSLRRPARADLVATVGETTGVFVLERLRQRMQSDPVGAEILRERPLVTVRAPRVWQRSL